MDPNYLSTFAWNQDTQTQYDCDHMTNIEHLDSLSPFDKMFEYKRLQILDFIPYTGESFWADQVYQMAAEDLEQPLFDYLMELDEKDRGNMFTNLYMLDFAEVLDDSDTYWADKAYQLSDCSQGIYMSIMDAAPENRANEFLLWASLNMYTGDGEY